jgi:YVTN family beta-propeller protein
MDFRILGPLEVDHEGRELLLEGRQQRALLALLLLHANEVVPVDEIIDELWPEAPPPSATRSVHALVSRLRRLLESEPLVRNGGEGDNGVLLTRSHGYLLKVAPGELDLHRFESLLRKGRDALAAGQPDVAARTLREALAHWRGPPLAEFAHDSFAVVDIARLNELRLSALEERIEADLAAGRSAELVAELEALIAAQPLRERLRGQLMLALYRCGRQAEALQVYQHTRRLLVDDLGIEPSHALQRLEQAILRQDGSLEPSVQVAPDSERSVRRGTLTVPRRRRVSHIRLHLPFSPGRQGLLLAAAAVGLAAAAATAVLLRSAGSSVMASPNSVAVIDPGTNRVVAAIPVGARPDSIAVGGGSAWVANVDEKTLSQIDRRKRSVKRTIPLSATPTALVYGLKAVWVAHGLLGTLSRVDPQYGTSKTIPAGTFARGAWGGVITGAGSVWVTYSDSSVTRINPSSMAVQASMFAGNLPSAIAFGNGSLWVANASDNTVTRFSPATNAREATISVGRRPSGVTVGARAVWVTATADDRVSRIDPRVNSSTTITVGDAPVGVAYGAGAVWVANSADGTVSRIDPVTGTVIATIPVGNSPRGIAFGHSAVWVTVQAQGARYLRQSPARSGVSWGAGTMQPTRVETKKRALRVANAASGAALVAMSTASLPYAS